MKRFSSTEIGILLLAILFFVVGLWIIINPKEMTLARQVSGRSSGKGTRISIEHMTKNEVVIGGYVSMAFGGVIIAAVIFPRRR